METSTKNVSEEESLIDMSAPSTHRPKKKHRGTIFATIVVVLLLIAAGGAFVYFKWFANPFREMTEVEAWSEITRFQTEEKYDSLEAVLHYYLDNYPQEKHQTEVANLLSRLETERRQWMDLLMYNCSVESVDNFVYSNPEGFYHNQAMHVLDSLVYRQAQIDNNEDGYLGYLAQFPKGMYVDEATKKLDEITHAEMTDDEKEKVTAVVKRHFETLQDNSADILETVAHDLASYLGKPNSTHEDVMNYMRHMHSKPGVKILEPIDFSVQKIATNDLPFYNVSFELVEILNPQDSLKKETKQFNGTAIMNNFMKITSLVLE